MVVVNYGDFLIIIFDNVVNWLCKFLLFQYFFVIVCCGMEYMVVVCLYYDIVRFGVEILCFFLRQLDVFWVVGIIMYKMFLVLKMIYDQMVELKWVIVFGVCVVFGGFYQNYLVFQGIDCLILVDVYIVGCLLCPEVVFDGLMELQYCIQNDGLIVESGMFNLLMGWYREQKFD